MVRHHTLVAPSLCRECQMGGWITMVPVFPAAAGIYRIIVTLNPSGCFLESNYSNNVGWASFELERDNEGLPTVSEIPESKGGIWFEDVNWPTSGLWPTYEPTKSPSPTATFSPSKCTGNTPNWLDINLNGCDWYEEIDLPGCPFYGNFNDGGNGTAMDNCCYCTLSQSPTKSPYPTYSGSSYPPTVEICPAELPTAKPTQRVRKRENNLFFRTGSCSRLFMRISLYSINATILDTL